MATPIRIKRSAVPAKKPNNSDLLFAELGLNTFDGRVFLKQDQGKLGIGTRVIEVGAGSRIGKTIFVTATGDDNNSGLNEIDSKATIKSAASIALPGDTIKVYPGIYLEDNPIVLAKRVSIEGTELRNCIITPKNVDRDLYYVNNGCHITDLSFRLDDGRIMTDGAAIVSFEPLLGVSTDRYFDASRMIRYNLDYIANETVGFLTSTQYIGAGRTQISDPVFQVVNSSGIATDSVNCSDDIKSVLKSVIHDITRGGNSKCVEAGESYYNENNSLLHITGTDPNGYSVKEATIDAIRYAADMSRAIINNSTWGSNPVGVATSVISAAYDSNSGIVTITAENHGLSQNDPVKIVGLGFTCPSGPGIVTYPSGNIGYIFNVKSIIGVNTFEAVVGKSTLPHTYVSGGTIQKYENFQNEYTQLKDLAIQVDPDTGFNNAVNGCANVVSAIYSCIGVVTSIIANTPSIVGSQFNKTYPGNRGVGFSSYIGITSAVYNERTGNLYLEAPGISVVKGDRFEIRNLLFECSSGGSISTQAFPSGTYGYEFYVDRLNEDNSFVVNVGTSTIPHNYVSGGFIVDRSLGITTATYDNISGLSTITAPGINLVVGDVVTLKDMEFSCNSGAGTTTIYPTGNNGYDFRVLDVVGSGGTESTFTVNVGTSTLSHTYVSGGIVRPPYSPGVGPITQGPYIRNCTNFVPGSIGMRVDGFEAEPGDQDDIGVTGSMSVDSFTQFNQGGIGVSITNGAYSQLVSIFTICTDIAIYTASGGQCDLTNSNSSFGTYGLYSVGVGDQTSKSIYHYTGIAHTTSQIEDDVIVVSGVGNQRPYDGQALFFGDLYYFVSDLKVTNPGSGYTRPPRITIDAPTGPQGAQAEGSPNINRNGQVISVDVIADGSQYETIPNVIVEPPDTPGGTTATVEAKLFPFYYSIESATKPVAGISTIILNQRLNNTVSVGTTIYFNRVSLQLTSSHSFEWVGSGNTVNPAKPALGGVVITDNEVVEIGGGQVVYTSTDQAGNFRIGDGLVANQLTGTISGRSFDQSIINKVNPLIIALG